MPKRLAPPEYLTIVNGHTTQPAFPGDDTPIRTTYSEITDESLKLYASDGWTVVSVSWRETEIIAALLTR